jgi:hypothetical protein
VRAAAARAATRVADTLQSCGDAAFRDVQIVAQFVVMASSSLMQTAVSDHTQSFDVELLRAHMRSMALGYLREMREREREATFDACKLTAPAS